MIPLRNLAAIPLAIALSGCGDGPMTAPVPPRPGGNVGPAPGNSATTPKTTTFTAHETICTFVAPGRSHVVDGVDHFRGRTVETRAEAPDPRYVGTARVSFRGRQDLATGEGTGHGRFTFEPDGIDGTWEGTFTGGWSGGLFSGHGVAHGTGELQGQTLHSRLQEHAVGPDDPTACPPVVGTRFVHSIRLIDSGA